LDTFAQNSAFCAVPELGTRAAIGLLESNGAAYRRAHSPDAAKMGGD
jgi:hypothetical protein